MRSGLRLIYRRPHDPGHGGRIHRRGHRGGLHSPPTLSWREHVPQPGHVEYLAGSSPTSDAAVSGDQTEPEPSFQAGLGADANRTPHHPGTHNTNQGSIMNAQPLTLSHSAMLPLLCQHLLGVGRILCKKGTCTHSCCPRILSLIHNAGMTLEQHPAFQHYHAQYPDSASMNAPPQRRHPPTTSSTNGR